MIMSCKIPPEPSGDEGGGDSKPYLMTYTAEQVSHHPPGKNELGPGRFHLSLQGTRAVVIVNFI